MYARKTCSAHFPLRQDSASRKRDHRQRLLADALRRHGVPAVALLLELIEADIGDHHIGIDARLERLVDLDEAGFADAARLLDGSRRR